MPKIDVYKEWLKIEATNRPLTYYQVLRLKQFEDDLEVIRKHYVQLNGYVRKFATGDYIEESQNLLNELAKAMLCLTDADRKAEYDFKLGRKFEAGETTTLGRRTLETILLEDGIVTPDQLKQAKNFADALGIELHEAVLQKKFADQTPVMMAYAETIGAPFVDLNDVPVDEFYAPQINPVTARQHSFVPVMADMGKLIVASPTPIGVDVEDELRLLFDTPVKCVICTQKQINEAIAKYYPRDAVQKLVARPDSDVKLKEQPKKPVVKASAREDFVESKASKLNRIKIAVVSFNFAFMAGAFGSYAFMKASTVKLVTIGLVFGAIAAAVAWFAAPKTEEDDE
ncbi:MAG: hypothetical protein HUK22_07440 [Thermoguttaceae bacterium]|nr:hypothetical protein [Thermoguttaceae bacterium]